MDMTAPLPPPADSADPAASRPAWQAAYSQVRQHTLRLTAGLSAEDLALQSMPDTSPGKWHLAHTTWFFETLVLQAHQAGYQLVDGRWPALFNSYYESLGPRHPRPQRGLLSRPSLDQVLHYRQQVDAAVLHFIGNADATTWGLAAGTLRLGLQHEQQHQELLLTDILHAFSLNPLRPAYAPLAAAPADKPTHTPAPVPAGGGWLRFGAGPVQIGQPTEAAADKAAQAHNSRFGFDNERPHHTVWLAPFELACKLVVCADFAAFIADGGYQQPALWLSDGWAQVQAQGWRAPAHWLPLASDGSHRDGFEHFSLHGVQPLDLAAPVCHLSGYEAAAFAAWAGARLPTEFEWEHAAVSQTGHSHHANPASQASKPGPLHQLLGAVWQWTSSAYAPYPGFRPLPGPAAEYNGKFMVNQLVLRGSSFATPAGHARFSYRNFFPPGARWQFSGLRLARDGVA